MQEDVIGGRASFVADDSERENFHRSTRALPTTRGHAGHPTRCYDIAGQRLTSRLCRAPEHGLPVNVRLECMGGIFDQRNPEPAARRAELDDTIGKTIGVTCQNGGKGRPRRIVDVVDAHVSIVGRHWRHHRLEPSREGIANPIFHLCI